MKSAEFRAVLEASGKTATGFEVPEEVVDGFGAGRRPPVRITLNGGYSYRSTVARMGGRYLLPVAAEHREGAGISRGELIDVRLELDDAPREVPVPDDFAAAMAARPPARERFDALAYTHRKEHVRAIEEAKKPETRQRRIEKAVAMLLE